MTLLLRIVRGSLSLLLFAFFALGAILISLPMIFLNTPDKAQPIVRASWRLIVWFFVHLHLIRVDFSGPRDVRGAVLVANHPSLIDVVLLLVLFPRTLYVAKHALLKSFFLARVIRATSLPDDASLPESAARYLKDGWNLLVFPEGTRTPLNGVLGTFHRGAAHCALRAAAPTVAIGISLSERILAKHQFAGDIGARRVIYTIRADSPVPTELPHALSVHDAACHLTSTLEERIRRLCGKEEA